MPDVLMVAMLLGLMLQVPPTVALLRLVVLPTQVVRVPVIAAGRSLTVTTVVRVQPVPIV